MIRGIGVDILKYKRLEPLRGDWDNPFFAKTFSEAERSEALQRSDPLVYFAGRFAAKEAVFKALRVNSNALRLSQIEVLTHADGYPEAQLINADGLVGVHATVFVSISHETDLVIAYATIVEG